MEAETDRAGYDDSGREVVCGVEDDRAGEGTITKTNLVECSGWRDADRRMLRGKVGGVESGCKKFAMWFSRSMFWKEDESGRSDRFWMQSWK